MAMRPRMHFQPDQYSKSIKVPTRCFVEEVLETFANVGLTEMESDWFENHPQFCHILHMPRSSHMVQSMWMLLLRTADIERKKEAWFVVNGVPIRYGIREHCLISGLDCKHYPEDWKVKGSLAFKRKHFRDGKVLRTEVKEKFETMGADDTGDRLKMAVLYFLSSIIYSPGKTGKQGTGVEDLFFRYVVDLDLCQTFPWGRYSFERILESIGNTMAHYGGTVTAPFVFPGFCIPLELLALEAIPHLKENLRDPVPPPFEDCPKMCRSKWKKYSLRGFPLEHVYEQLGPDNYDIDSLLIATDEEKEMLDDIADFEDVGDHHDPIVESWEKRLKAGYTIQFEDMRVADVEGRKTADVGMEPGAKKVSLNDLVVVVGTFTEQLSLINDKLGELDGRMKSVEEDVAVLKGRRLC